jgi:hypothetical protein
VSNFNPDFNPVVQQNIIESNPYSIMQKSIQQQQQLQQFQQPVPQFQQPVPQDIVSNFNPDFNPVVQQNIIESNPYSIMQKSIQQQQQLQQFQQFQQQQQLQPVQQNTVVQQPVQLQQNNTMPSFDPTVQQNLSQNSSTQIVQNQPNVIEITNPNLVNFISKMADKNKVTPQVCVEQIIKRAIEEQKTKEYLYKTMYT